MRLSAQIDGTWLETRHDEACPDIGPICEERDEPPQIHDQSIGLAELRLGATLGLGGGLAAEVVLPLRLLTTTIRYENLQGQPIELDYENIHHRDETLFGLADPWLGARWDGALGERVVVGARLAASLPLGGTEPDPFELGERGERHQHVQFGSGTFRPVLGVDGRVTVGDVSIGGGALAVLSLYENGEGYQGGHRLGFGLGASSGFGLDWASFRLGAETSIETAERWGGHVPESDGNRGRVDVIATLGATLISGATSVGLEVKVPVYTHVVGGQLEYPIIVGLRFDTELQLWGGEAAEPPHEHRHEHGHDHDHGHGHDAAARGYAQIAGIDANGLDLVEISQGEEVELAPVPGKITIFDFWAGWCEPCHDLARRLAALSRAHPGRFAIRTIRVETWDRPAARRYLSEAPALPHVRVFGDDGSAALTASGNPEEIVRQIEALVP